MADAKRLYLIDGYSIIFRAFYAIPPLSNSKGEPTNAVYGFVNMLRKLLREQEPGYVGAAWDVSGDTVRKERFEGYKANRKPMPDDLRSQIPWIRKTLDAFRIPILEVERYEADDVLGTLARKASAESYEVVLVSADKDLMQLLGPRIRMLHTGQEKLYDETMVEGYIGVPPHQVVDYLAIVGDTSDNVPGVPGIGKKGAAQLLADYQTMDNLLEHAEEVKRKSYREGLIEHRDQALMSRELVTIECDLDVPFDAEALRYEAPRGEELAPLYRELEFFTLLEELQEAGEIQRQSGLEAATEVEDPAALSALAEGCSRLALAAVGEPVLGLALALGDTDGRALFVDFRRPGSRLAAQEALRRWLGDPELEIVGHDLKEVLRLVPEAPVAARLVDTMLLAYLLRSSSRSFGLDEVCFERLQVRPMQAKEAGWAKKQEPMLGDETLLTFAAERSLLPLRLEETMHGELETSGEATAAAVVYDTIEAPLVPVLVRMEEAGVLLDVPFLEEMSGELETELAGLEEEIYEIAGERFNIQSPQQLGSIMFEKLDYPVLRRTRKTKSYSTGAETLEELASQGFDLPQKVLDYREASKLKSTYVDALPGLVAEDGRLHTRYQQAVAATGRLSSMNPNLQNIPIRTEAGRRIRKAFKAPEGRRLLVADYSQIELRILAHIAREEALIEAFKRGEDIHASTAALVFGGTPELVTPDQRRAAKVINFGIIYGMSPFGLGRNLGIPQKEAKQFIDAYFERFAAVKTYVDETVEVAREEGKVETLYGRARWLPDIRSKNWNLRENAKRMAINARIQGTAADLLKKAMIRVDQRLREEHPDAALLLTVHDELVVEVPAEKGDELLEQVTADMRGVEELVVPLEVEAGLGETWYEAKA